MLKLTGGEFRGRSIKTPHDQTTRPTQARLRQALFNAIQFRVPDARVLDLFSGAGTLGIEALSRGASEAVFVELSKAAVKLLSENINEFKLRDRTQIISESVETVVARAKTLGPFDIVVADPPYSEGWEDRLLKEMPWEVLLSEGGVFCLEWGRLKSQVKELPDQLPFLVKIREKIYGESVLTTYERPSS